MLPPLHETRIIGADLGDSPKSPSQIISVVMAVICSPMSWQSLCVSYIFQAILTTCILQKFLLFVGDISTKFTTVPCINFSRAPSQVEAESFRVH